MDCWINVDGWAVRVMDDGQGIGRAGMKTVGERYGELNDRRSQMSNFPSLLRAFVSKLRPKLPILSVSAKSRPTASEEKVGPVADFAPSRSPLFTYRFVSLL